MSRLPHNNKTTNTYYLTFVSQARWQKRTTLVSWGEKWMTSSRGSTFSLGSLIGEGEVEIEDKFTLMYVL